MYVDVMKMRFDGLMGVCENKTNIISSTKMMVGCIMTAKQHHARYTRSSSPAVRSSISRDLEFIPSPCLRVCLCVVWVW